MARSRSSFEITGAIATAAALAPELDAKKKKETPGLGGAPLVSFGAPVAPEQHTSAPTERRPSVPPSSSAVLIALQNELPPSSGTDSEEGIALRSALPPSASGEALERTAYVSPQRALVEVPPYPAAPLSVGVPASARRGPASALPGATSPSAPAEMSALDPGGVGALSMPADDSEASDRAPPRLPDLTDLASPMLRCEQVIEWIVEATGASDVFLADAAGLPFAGAIRDAEARIAASGWVASAVGALAAALPGAPSPLFELHIGEGPFFQLIGFQVSAGAYVVGLIRGTPLTPRQAQAIRAACRRALAGTLGGAS